MTTSNETTTSKFLKLIATVDGRDKLYKTLQYGSRTAWWITHSKDPKNPALAKLASLDAVLSEARRVFRLGGFVKEYKEFVACKESKDVMGRFKMVNHLGNCIGETMDVIIWCAKLKVVSLSKERWEWWRNVLWMINVLYSLTDQYLLFRQTWKVYTQLVCPIFRFSLLYSVSLVSLSLSHFLSFLSPFFSFLASSCCHREIRGQHIPSSFVFSSRSNEMHLLHSLFFLKSKVRLVTILPKYIIHTRQRVYLFSTR
jgi:hypothetical protein